MSRTSLVARYAGRAVGAIGLVSAGAAAGVLAERKLVSRRRSVGEEPFGSVRGAHRTVVADDGLELYVEIDELDGRRPAARGKTRADTAPVFVFVHGYALNLDCWHFQRLALRGRYRMILFDLRSHGRSGRSQPDHSTIDQLGRDLTSVLDECADGAPVVLVGHSMGGMTIMALAEQHPEWFGKRVVAVALISTSSGGLSVHSLGLPGLPGRLLNRVVPPVVATLARAPRLVESGRRASSDIGFVLTRRLAFGGPVPQEYVDFTDEMLAATPFGVVAEFFPGFEVHDKAAALSALTAVPTVVICGTKDAITPISHSRAVAELVPTAQLLEVDGAGHMVILERHAEVSAALLTLGERAAA